MSDKEANLTPDQLGQYMDERKTAALSEDVSKVLAFFNKWGIKDVTEERAQEFIDIWGKHFKQEGEWDAKHGAVAESSEEGDRA